MSVADDIIGDVMYKVKDLSDSEYLDTLEEIVGTLQDYIDAKRQEMGDE